MATIPYDDRELLAECYITLKTHDPDLAARYSNVMIKLKDFKPDVAYMPVPRCDGCKYWEPHKMYKLSGEVIDVKDLKDLGHCEQAMDAKRERVKMFPDLYDGINTAADFGCVQWEAK